MFKNISILLLLFLTYCTSPLIIKGFDKEAWISDKNGCLTTRKGMIDLVMENKDVLLGKDQDQIKGLLGKPDMHEIYKRGQRFYIYELDPSPSCPGYIADKKELTLRYDLMPWAGCTKLYIMNRKLGVRSLELGKSINQKS